MQETFWRKNGEDAKTQTTCERHDVALVCETLPRNTHTFCISSASLCLQDLGSANKSEERGQPAAELLICLLGNCGAEEDAYGQSLSRGRDKSYERASMNSIWSRLAHDGIARSEPCSRSSDGHRRAQSRVGHRTRAKTDFVERASRSKF